MIFARRLVTMLVGPLLTPVLISSAFFGCASQPIIPAAKNVTLSREEPSKKCRELGKVQGTVQTPRGKIEDAIEDMKLDAARKGANYVHMEETSAYGTSVNGTAYQCP